MAATDIRTARVRFTEGPLGLVRGDYPFRFVEQTVQKGDEGDLIVEGDQPFTPPEGWVIVRVDDDLYAPVHPAMVEVIR